MYNENLKSVATRQYAYERWLNATQQTESVANRVSKLESAVSVSGDDNETKSMTASSVTAGSVTADSVTLTKQDGGEEIDVRAKFADIDEVLDGKSDDFTATAPLSLVMKENSDERVLSVVMDEKVTKDSSNLVTSGAIAEAIEESSGLGAGVKSVGNSLNVNADTGVLNVGSSVVTAVKVGSATLVPEGRPDGVAGGVVTIPVASTTGEGVVRLKEGGGLQALNGEVGVGSQVVTQLTLGDKVVSPTARSGGAAGGSVAVPYASDLVYGIVRVGSGLSVSEGTLSTDLTGIISGVRVGADSADVVSPDVNGRVTVPAATSASYGVVKVGSGLATASDGSLRVDGTCVVKDIKVYKGTATIEKTSDGVVELPAATSASYGVVKVGSGLTVTTDGVLSIDISTLKSLLGLS